MNESGNHRDVDHLEECVWKKHSRQCGFSCNCDRNTDPGHGLTHEDPCHEATCYHCSWTGEFPPEEVKMSNKRVSWDEYFLRIATDVATRATCDRKHVGAVIVRDKTILSTGYNGSVRGLPHCDDVGHMMEDNHCVATIHAEQNAIIQAAKNGTAIDGSTIYTTASPCWPCFKMIANSGMKRIVFAEFYRDERIFSVAESLGIALEHLDLNPES